MRIFRLALVCAVLAAQPAGKAKFDFVSILQASEVDHGCNTRINSPLQFTVHGCTARGLIFFSWKLRDQEMSLPPNVAWISSVPWDVSAKSSLPAPVGNHWQMMQAVLKERFALKFHREKRERPVFYLSVAKGGLKLAPSRPGNGCRPFDHTSPPRQASPWEAPYCDYPTMPFTKDGRGAEIIGIELSIQSLVKPALTLLMGRPVIDRTGLSGGYDVHLTFAKDSVPAFGLSPVTEPSGLPGIFAALHNVGLELASGKGPVDVLVVDSVQKPSEN